MNKLYKITGLDCASCASMIELDLEDVGIKASCSYPNETLEVEETHNFDKIKKVVEKSGYCICKF